MRRGHGQRRTQLEVQQAIDANIITQLHFRIIDRAVYFTVLCHPGLPDIKGTIQTFLPILDTSERMSMVFSRPPVVSFSQTKNLSLQLCRAKLQELQNEAIQSSCVTSTSNGRTFHCLNQGTKCNTKWAVYVIMRYAICWSDKQY